MKMRNLKLMPVVVMMCMVALLAAGCATPSGRQPIESSNDYIPMFGQPSILRTEVQRKADANFINEAVVLYGNRENASKAWAKVANEIFDKGNLDFAMLRYNQAWLLNENNYQVYWGYGQIMSMRGKLDEAIKYYEKANSLIDDAYQKPALLNYLGTTYSRKARNMTMDKDARARYFAIANRYFKESAELDQTYPDVWEGWANSLFFEGNYAEAWDKVKKADAMGHPVQKRFREGLSRAMPEPN